MTRRLSILASCVVFYVLLTSSLTAIDVTNMDVSTLRENTLFDIARALALEYPTEISEALMKLTNITYGDESVGRDIFNQLASSDTFADQQQRCDNCSRIFTRVAQACAADASYNRLVQAIIAVCHVVVEAINNATAPLGRVATKADPLCAGTVLLHAPHIREVLKFNPVSFPAEDAAAAFCENLNQCIPAATMASSSPSSQFVINERTKVSPIEQNGSGRSSRVANSDDVITVVQLTDIHVEQHYAIGSPTDCGLPVCCLDKWNGTGRGQATPFGEYSCNVPQRTVELFLSKVQKMNPDVILFSGDIPPHTVWEETEESQTNCTILLTESIRRTMPNSIVYPCIGNHETYPTNLFSRANLNGTPRFTTSFYDLWRDIANFDDNQKNDILNGGYYSKLIRPGLRLLTYNSLYMYTFNWYNTLNVRNITSGIPPSTRQGEIYDMKAFMANELAKAKVNQEKVIILGHHPIGGSDILVSLSRWYQSLVVQYSDIIVLQPTGHTHLDEMRLIYDSAGRPASVVLVSPSISAGGTKNPSMRVYYLNKDDYKLVDYEQYYLGLRSSQVSKRRVERAVDLTDMITKLYSAKDTYNMSDLSPQSWHDLVVRFESDPALLSRHLSLSDASAKRRYICQEQCQHDYICRQRNADFDKYTECVDSYNGTRPSIDDVTRPQADASSTTTQPPGSISTESSGLKTAGAVNINVLMLVCIAALCGQRTFISIDQF